MTAAPAAREVYYVKEEWDYEFCPIAESIGNLWS